MKFLFLKANELSNVAKQIITKEKGTEVNCHVGYSESLGTDVITVQYADKADEEIAITSFLGKLGEEYQEKIMNFDVFEVGDLGEGFAFTLA